MTPERWRQIKAIFQEASERAEAERAVFLDTACAGDAELRREVESLLATDELSAYLRAAFAARRHLRRLGRARSIFCLDGEELRRALTYHPKPEDRAGIRSTAD